MHSVRAGMRQSTGGQVTVRAQLSVAKKGLIPIDETGKHMTADRVVLLRIFLKPMQDYPHSGKKSAV